MADVVVVKAGAHRRVGGPVRVPWEGEAPGGLEAAGHVVAAQADGAELVFVPGEMAAGDVAEYRPAAAPEAAGVRVRDDGRAIHVTVGGEEFTTYHYADVPARPYFWPVLAPGGIAVTRAYPMREGVRGETADHPHHRSLYFAYGDVNGVDNWSEEPGHGRTIHRSVDEIVSGPVFGRFATTSDWTDAAGDKVLTQGATVTFWARTERARLMDVALELAATEGDVRFGDTKEGGLLTARVASALDVPRGGTITNSYGGVNEGETWGHPAHWCDYSGVVDGVGVGIAVMDHPRSFRHPTYWHVRDYGLMAANPFALHDYLGGGADGSYLLPAGQTIRFLYRVVVHTGGAAEADVRGHYLNYVAPATAERRQP